MLKKKNGGNFHTFLQLRENPSLTTKLSNTFKFTL